MDLKKVAEENTRKVRLELIIKWLSQDEKLMEQVKVYLK